MGATDTRECENPRARADPSASPGLLVRSGPERGKLLGLAGDRVVLGRANDCDVTLAGDTISGVHAAITRDGGGRFWLEDLGSKNGTFVGARRVNRERLRDGEVFSLCRDGPELEFVLRPASGSGEARPPGRVRGGPRLLAASAALLVLSGALLAAALGLQARGSTRRAMEPRLVNEAPVVVPETVAAAAEAEDAPHLELELAPLYGCLFLSYRDHPLGTARVTNLRSEPLRDLSLELAFLGDAAGFLVEPFIAKLPEIPPRGSGRERVSVPIVPKLSTGVLSERTREVTVRVALSGAGHLLGEITRAVIVHDRNVFLWDDPERAAVFVDPNDPAVLSFVRRAWRERPPSSPREFPPPNVAGAVTLLTSLADLGLSYLPDARNPIAARFAGVGADRVSYPAETLRERSGDCDDLAVLACSVLEAAGIPCALAAGAGHVLFLFDTGLSAAHGAEGPFAGEAAIPWRGRLWLPVEATELARAGASFTAAWAAAWPRREALLRSAAEAGPTGGPPSGNGPPATTAAETKIVELREAWRSYPPLGASERGRIEAPEAIAAAPLPSPGPGLGARIVTEIEGLRALARERLERRALEIRRREGEGPRAEQAVALLHARSGLFAEARRALEKALFGPPSRGGAAHPGIRGEAAPATPSSRARALGPLTEEQAVLLYDLALCLSLGAGGPRDLDEAAACAELALDGFPPEAAAERGAVMLRLALLHRLRGGLTAEAEWRERAFALGPAFRDAYDSLLSGDGTEGARGAPDVKISGYFAAGLR